MKRLGKLSLIITLILLLLPFNNGSLYAAKEGFFEENTVILQSENEEEIEVFEDISSEIPITTVQNNTVATLISEIDDEEDVVKIRVIDELEEEVEGYVSREYITYPEEELDEEAESLEDVIEKTREAEDINGLNINELNNRINVDEVTDEEMNEEKSENKTEVYNILTVQVNSSSPPLEGYAQLEPTSVYSEPSKDSKVLKSYRAGHLLKFREFNGEWYRSRVKVNGEYVTCYIHKNDVGDELPQLEAYAQNDPTNVYASTSINSKVLKAYRAGHKLKFRPYDNNWYTSRVKVNGEYVTCYIHKNDVGDELPQLEGYAQLEPTHVYSVPSKSSNVLKSYRAGHVLKFRPYDNNWYTSKVKVNGKYVTCYIHKNDVGDELPLLEGITQLEPTNVYASTSKDSKVLKSYRAGHVLKFRPYNNNWYTSRVKVNGEYVTCYIHKNDVGDELPLLEGITQLEPTNVYASTSKGSEVLKSYRAGHVLKFRPYNNNWYTSKVKVNGKYVTCYIHKNDVGNNLPLLQGIAIKQTTSVYSNTSRSSTILKSYRKGHLLKYRPHNNSWYKATVYINGKAHSGYIHRSDVVNSTGKTIVIDAGHGGSDPGALGNNLQEKDINLYIAKRVQQFLEEAGFRVIMTRTSDQYLTLSERSSLANKSNADLFVSIHTNAGGGQGIETWWYSKGPEPHKSEALAKEIQKEVIKQTGTKDRGVKDGNLHVNRETKMPSALIEVGFIDNKNDAAKLKSTNYKDQVARGIAYGIKNFFQIFI